MPCLRQQTHENKNRSTRHPQHVQISSNSSTIATDNNAGMYIIHYSIEHTEFSAEYTISTRIVILTFWHRSFIFNSNKSPT